MQYAFSMKCLCCCKDTLMCRMITLSDGTIATAPLYRMLILLYSSAFVCKTLHASVRCCRIYTVVITGILLGGVITKPLIIREYESQAALTGNCISTAILKPLWILLGSADQKNSVVWVPEQSLILYSNSVSVRKSSCTWTIISESAWNSWNSECLKFECEVSCLKHSINRHHTAVMYGGIQARW